MNESDHRQRVVVQILLYIQQYWSSISALLSAGGDTKHFYVACVFLLNKYIHLRKLNNDEYMLFHPCEQ
jgi:hypothetical protein